MASVNSNFGAFSVVVVVGLGLLVLVVLDDEVVVEVVFSCSFFSVCVSLLSISPKPSSSSSSLSSSTRLSVPLNCIDYSEQNLVSGYLELDIMFGTLESSYRMPISTISSRAIKIIKMRSLPIGIIRFLYFLSL